MVIRRKLVECEIELISATEPTGNSPTEKFVETMLAGFAQMDNDIRSERAKNGLRTRFQAGLTGYVTMGYDNQNGYTTKNPEAFDKLQAAWHLFSTGTKTLRDIAGILTEQGVAQRHKGGLASLLGVLLKKRSNSKKRGLFRPILTRFHQSFFV